MKDREYFEYLLSLELDNDLSPEQTGDLERQLSRDSKLRAFRSALRSQQQVLRSLPTLQDAVAGSPPAKPKTDGVITRLWRVRLNLPVPVAAAAAVVLLLGGMFLSQTSTNKGSQDPASPKSARLELYESERLAPQSARLISQQNFIPE